MPEADQDFDCLFYIRLRNLPTQPLRSIRDLRGGNGRMLSSRNVVDLGCKRQGMLRKARHQLGEPLHDPLNLGVEIRKATPQ